MSNTGLRILSALVMIGIGFLGFFWGRPGVFWILNITTVLFLDEILVNLLKKKRFSLSYSLSFYSLFALIYVAGVFMGDILIYFLLFQGAFLAIGGSFFLFLPESFLKTPPWLSQLIAILGTFFFWGGLYFLLNDPNWKTLLLILLVTTYSTDSFAWLFGKTLGKTPLWPSVSPKKTVEGAIGGYIGGASLGLILWYIYIGSTWSVYILGILGIPLLANLGDLFQSRLKRIVGLKDSSNLIPGHGGVFDRVDSLIMILPVYLAIVWGYYAG